MMVLAIVVSFWSGYVLGALWARGHYLHPPKHAQRLPQRQSKFRSYLDHIEQEMVEEGYIKRSV